MLELLEVKEYKYTPNGTKIPMGLYLCSCGNQSLINVYNVRSGKQVRCSLCKGGRRSHGLSKTVTYQRWEDMKGRCRPTAKRADRYFDRGIGYAPGWEAFEGFYADMGECPDGMELDRIDNDKGYSKDNCQWVSRSMNVRNRTETNRRGKSRTQNVRWDKRSEKWIAYTKHGDKVKHIGSFPTEEEGRQAYNAFAAQHGYPLR